MALRPRSYSIAFALPLPFALAGCLAYSNVKRDVDRTPVVHHGVGATILMPGQTAPAMPTPVRGIGQRGAPAPVYAPPGGVPAPGSGGSTSGSSSGFGTGSGSGSGGGTSYGSSPGYGGGTYGQATPGEPVGGGSNIQFIGGAEIDEVRHREIRQDPLLVKALLAPVAAVAWPFKKLYQAAQGEPQPVVRPAPPNAPPRGPADYESAYEASQLEALERQVTSPQAGAAPQAPAPRAPAVASAPRASSISDELALLQRRVQPRGVAMDPGGAPGSAGAPAPAGVADKVSDRNGDGRPDVWQYREGGALVRELFDEDADGRVDHTVRYDPASGQKTYEEEDSNVDGQIDSWVEYKDGEVVRRRQDANGDGQPDAWTLYRGGQLARVEEDRNGDGFHDRVGYYQEGKLRREVEDANGDGRPDRVTLYDDAERARERSEDLNGDGLVDARSFFENGKLVRRELVDESLGGAQPLVEEEQLGTPEGFSDGDEG
jgi:hypothetical protein